MKITYRIENSDYNIFIKKKIDSTLTNQINYLKSDKNVLFVYDNNIDLNLLDKTINFLKDTGCKVTALKFQSSKKNKNEKSLFSLIDVMLENKFTKKSLVISFGGGVLGDVCALAASLYLRGLIYFHIPSTMTAIIDSCIGGKTAINYRNIINSVGNYYHAQSVFIFNEVINLLPEREFLSGIPEIIKCGLIKKNNILKLLKNKKKILERDEKIIAQLCCETLLTKIFFFKSDVYEKNRRLLLNFGHTFAHAIEMTMQSILNKEVFRHGEAVGIGILCELYYASGKKNNLFRYVKTLLENYNLPTKISLPSFNIKKTVILDSVYKNIFLDKKRVSKTPRFISLRKMHKPKIREMENLNLLAETISQFI